MLPSPPAEMNHETTPKRKRSRSDVEAEDARDNSFQLENLGSSTFLTFESVSKLLRAHLPLSWLGSPPANTSVPPGSLLQGQIKQVSSLDYSVLVARQIPNGGLYVLEKVEDACFVVHPLQPFVSEKWIKDASIGAAPPVSMQMLMHYVPMPEYPEPRDLCRTPSMTASDTAVKVPKNRRGAAARLSILSQMEKQDDGTPSPRLQELPQHVDEPQTVVSAVSDAPQQIEAPLEEKCLTLHAESAAPAGSSTTLGDSQTDLLTPAYLRQRYLDHLYKVKTSLAFYVKGPLGRARARAKAENASMTIADLANFYRDSVLSAKRMDLKYKESLKDAILSIAQNSEAAEDEHPKRKPTKRTKLGKDGLWPTEPEFIRFWWYRRDSKAATSQADNASELRDAVAAQRMREAQMQMILILEILVIEAKQNERKGDSQKPVSEDPDAKVESIEQEVGVNMKSEKRVRKRDLEAELGVLADKMCIWHSVGLELNDSQDSHKTKGDEDGEQDETRHKLRHFCTDILIAFYNHRLPTLCRRLCKTLAGPVLYDQIQKEARIKQNNAKSVPPGAVLRRAASKNGQLERVLSEQGSGKPSPPALLRSSTLPPVPHFKREPSETFSRSHSRQMSLSFSNREVDLEADAQATASKKRKLDLVTSQKQELAAAIQALKKPNRQDAGKGYMDELELRRSQLKQPVLITATPKADRRKTMGDARDEPIVLPVAVTDMLIPSSTTKSRVVGTFKSASRSSSKKRAVLAAIHDTPSRSTSRKSDPLQINSRSSNRRQSSAELVSVPDAILATPSKPKPKPKDLSEVFTTPMKMPKSSADDKENEFRVTEMACKTMDRAMAMPVADTIYDTLGWNNDYDL